jgi:hypothetical protein
MSRRQPHKRRQEVSQARASAVDDRQHIALADGQVVIWTNTAERNAIGATNGPSTSSKALPRERLVHRRMGRADQQAERSEWGQELAYASVAPQRGSVPIDQEGQGAPNYLFSCQKGRGR